MPKITIDGKSVEVAKGLTIIQACEQLGISIPRFCYHEKLEIAGNCRMCLVQVEKAPKPVASCAQEVMEGMVVHTNTEMVKKAREGVMEFLLINHPLDCPICDQGGECDLQDQALFYGRDENRFIDEKRSVKAKDMGPLISTYMTRCIHCTRCVRFIEDIAGTTELGAVGRGENMEITTCIEGSLTSELSGNIIDLCPVGALTSAPFAFSARSWELKHTDSIDILDAVGSNIRIDSKGTQVMRILPRLHEEINEDWIADKTRFAYDGLKYQRLDRPYLRNEKGSLEECELAEAYDAIIKRLQSIMPEQIAVVAGDLTDLETMFTAKKFLNILGSRRHECRQNGLMLDHYNQGFYTFNSTIEGIEEADYCLIIGSNPRTEAAMLNARIRKAVVKKGLKVAVIGEELDLNYPYEHLGTNPWLLKQILDKTNDFYKDFASAKRPMIIVGIDVFARPDAKAFLHTLKNIANSFKLVRDDWNGFNVLPRTAAIVGGLDLGFTQEEGDNINSLLGESGLIFLCGADEVDINKIAVDATVVYIGHHGDKAMERADIVIPTPAYTEKSGTYVNLEGRVQQTNAAVDPLPQAVPEWQIFVDIARQLGVSLGIESFAGIRKAMVGEHKWLKNIGIPKTYQPDLTLGKSSDFASDHFNYHIKNYYMTDPISRASKTMALCSRNLKKDVKRI